MSIKIYLFFFLLGKIIPFVPGIPGPNSLASNAPPISSIVQPERIYNTNQKALSILDHAVTHEKFTPLGLPLHHNGLSISSPNLKIDSISMEETNTFEQMKMRENDVREPKSSPETQIDSARRGENCHPYSCEPIGSPQNPVVVAPHVFRRHKSALVMPMPAPKITSLDKLSTKCSNGLIDENVNKVRAPDIKKCSAVVVNSNDYAFNLSTTNRDRCCNEKPFNFTRMADNLSPPPKTKLPEIALNSAELETNLEKIKSKLLVQTYFVENAEVVSRPSENSLEKESCNAPTLVTKTPKFLRPSSLPLKPGTFTPKKHHGITPTSNTFALISPETPRPSKNCVQLYLNGHAYTYLGLKCSTKPFYCTVNRPQPVHFTNQPKLSKLSSYSNWQTCAENNPHPLGFSPVEVISLYDSRQRQQLQCQRGIKYTIANRLQYTTLHSQSVKLSQQASDIQLHFDANRRQIVNESHHSIELSAENDHSIIQNCSSLTSTTTTTSSSSAAQVTISAVYGGYKSNEEYTYIRGRGRGQYVCLKCGIRCRKPSMLKKHIRTHSDDRPYTCRLCKFR